MGYVRVYCGKEFKQEIALEDKTISIGRDKENDIILADPAVSKNHAVIERVDGEYFIRDLDSRNGMFLGKERVNQHQLKYWDEIQIHNFIIQFMSKRGLGADGNQDLTLSSKIGGDKTQFFDISSDKQLESLRNQEKVCYISYMKKSGGVTKQILENPKTVIGKGREATIKVGGWFSTKLAATVEKQGNNFELVPGKRGKVLFDGEPLIVPKLLRDGDKFSVQGTEFNFHSKLAKTS